MKPIAIILGALALLGTIVPSILFLNGSVSHDAMKLIMLIACVVWFVTAPVWMRAR
jgi:hypothetical protein